MSITTDLKTYADTAFVQGKQALGQAIASFDAVSGTVTSRATETLGEFRAQAEKTLEPVLTVVSPYVEQAKDYTNAVTDRAETLLADVAGDPRVAKALSTGQALAGTVIDTVQQRVVAPVRAFTGRAAAPAAAAESNVTPAATPAATAESDVTPAATPAATSESEIVLPAPAAAPRTTKAAAAKPARPAAE